MPNKRYTFKNQEVPRWVFYSAIVIAFLYISWWLHFSNIGNIYLYTLLLLGELFYLYTSFGYWFTVWNTKPQPQCKKKYLANLDIYIPVCGEDILLIEKTILAVFAMKYKNKRVKDYLDQVHVYVLNDGYVARKANWMDVNALEKKYFVHVITRQVGGGAKAGNLNHALQETKGKYIAIFDADMTPYANFLQKTLGYFQDKTVAFVQTPQFYYNYNENFVTAGAWAQQELFFGAICKGKNNMNATFCCGTNVVFRKKALVAVGGFDTKNIAEDFATSINIHAKKWKSIYVEDILAEGLAPRTLEEYYGQQFRWAKGSLDVFFHNNPLFKQGLYWKQKLQYLLSLSYYVMSLFIIIDACIPIFYLFTHIVPVKGSPYIYVLLFFPYIFLIAYILSRSTNGRLSYNALQFSIGLFYVHLRAMLASILHQEHTFRVTNKGEDTNNTASSLHLIVPHLFYIILGTSAIIFSYYRYGLTPALITNTAWILFTIAMLSGHVRAAIPKIPWHIARLPKRKKQYYKIPYIHVEIKPQS